MQIIVNELFIDSFILHLL